jgi:hypothetical protein
VFIPGSRFDWGLPPEVVRKGIRFPKQAFPSGPLEPRAEDAVVFSTWLEVVGKSQWRSKIGLAIGLGIERTREEIRTWETGYRNRIIAVLTQLGREV